MERTYKLYEVGGAVRDSLMGLKSKDIDYTVVVSSYDQSATAAFEWFLSTIKTEGYEVFLSTPEVFTIRARFPKDHIHSGLVADFVLARKEEGYVPGTRRPELCVLGTLEDDLRRRDFCVNAVARDMSGNLIDPFGGMYDIYNRMLSCPIDAETSFNDDPLRVLRAIRFAVTKNFNLSTDIYNAIHKLNVYRFIQTVSTERVREELDKMFRFDTIQSFKWMSTLSDLNPDLFHYILSKVWLKPTTEM